jgi:hypothetical protein
MWSTVGAIGVIVLLAVMIFVGCASMVRSLSRGRYTMQGEDVEELMFRSQHDRRLDRRAGMAVTPRWWQRHRRA